MSLVFVVENRGRVEHRKGLSTRQVAREWLREHGHQEHFVLSFVDIDGLLDPDSRFVPVQVDELTKVWFKGEEVSRPANVLTSIKIDLRDADHRAMDPLLEGRPWFR